MPAARSPASIAIARHRAESTPPPLERAHSDQWMTPANSADPTYSDPAAAAAWLARLVAQAKAEGRASTDVEGSGAGEAQPTEPEPPEEP